MLPHADLNTSTATLESPDVSIDGTVTGDLVTNEVGVVGGVDEVLGEGLGHVLE
jgi:hypothetical protein